MLKKLSLKVKLLISFGLMAALLGLVGGIAFLSFESITDNYGRIASSTLPNAIALGKLMAGQKDIVIGISNLLGSETSPQDLKEQSDFIKMGRDDFQEAKKEYLAIPFEPGEKLLWDQVEASFRPFDEFVDELFILSSHGDHAEFVRRDELGRTKFPEIRKKARLAITALIDFQEANAKKLRLRAERADQTAKIVIATAALVGFVIAAVLGILLSSSLAKSLGAVSSNLASGATSVSAAAQQIAAASEQLSAAVTEQASSLEETSASIEEINAMISRNAENSQAAVKGTASAKLSVEEGQSALHDVSAAISQIQNNNDLITRQTESSAQEFDEIVKLIGEIAVKTKIINDIVFQTKLLSFNASVEAARAGEHGKGFAVVAEEVGNLARMSGSAASEISSMLNSSVSRVETIVSKNRGEISDLVREGRTCVGQGEKLVQKCLGVFESIVRNVEEVDQMSTSIATASNEQKQGVSEVTRAIAQLSQVNSQNASASNQAASAAEGLAAQSIGLESLVSQLAGIVKGNSTSTDDASGAHSGESNISRRNSQSGDQPVWSKAA